MITAANHDQHDHERHPSFEEIDELLTYKEVAKVLRVTPQTVKRRVDAGDLEAVDMNGRPRIRRVVLRRYLAGLKTR